MAFVRLPLAAFACAVVLSPTMASAEVYYTRNVLKDAVTPMVRLEPGTGNHLTGMTDGEEPLSAHITLDDARTITTLAVSQDGQALFMPDSAWNTLTGADTAWLEERGALSTLVLEGYDAEIRRWRVALLFHDAQLWKRRASLEGQGRDQFTFYDRKDGIPGESKTRGAGNKGLYSR